LGSSPGEDGFCSRETKRNRKWHKEQNCFSEEITGTEVTDLKTVLGSSLDEDVGFRDNNFFYDIQ
jgi:hypothetical protein